MFRSRGCHGFMNISCFMQLPGWPGDSNVLQTKQTLKKVALESWEASNDEEFAVLMAEVYVVGQICSAENFREPNLFLRWNFQAGLCGK